jgi:hypothetical protein
MQIERRTFNKFLILTPLAATLPMLQGCNASTDLQKVLALLPTVEAIGNSVLSVVAAIDPAIGVPVKAAVTIIESSFTIVEGIIKAYQTNIAGMPPSVLNDLDAAIAAISSEMNAIESQFPNISPGIASAISIGLAAFQTILGLIAALLPAPVAAQMFPRAFSSLAQRHITIGISAGAIPTPRAFAQNYNARIKNAGHPEAQIHVPWKYHLIP